MTRPKAKQALLATMTGSKQLWCTRHHMFAITCMDIFGEQHLSVSLTDALTKRLVCYHAHPVVNASITLGAFA